MAADDSNSDCELVIDETIEISSDEEDSKRHILHPVSINTAVDITTDEKKCQLDDLLHSSSIFHPMSISAADIKEELLYHEDTYTCTICNESFRYNIGLIFHSQTEHLNVETEESKPVSVVKSTNEDMKCVKRKYLKKGSKRETPKLILKSSQVEKQTEKALPYGCECCRRKAKKGRRQGGMEFTCMFCNMKFCWESKYKKHLYKTHKLNAAVVCKFCSQVFDDMTQLSYHTRSCKKATAEFENVEKEEFIIS